jgi:small subunit ribosomal protein S5e
VSFLPHSAGRWQKKRFRKAQCPIVERLTNAIMMKGRNNGKKVPIYYSAAALLFFVFVFHTSNLFLDARAPSFISFKSSLLPQLMAVRIVQHAFDIIHLLTDENPIQVHFVTVS